ncbi:MAG TPA: MarR family transcriptional regulator [Acidimicrobiales bacterium]|nr:MarR family transcriptional regulator [Acidimicrobiales bacterium]
MTPSLRRTRAGTSLPPAHDPRALSWLLRRTVRRYAAPVARALDAGGFGDLPQRGVWAVSALARTEPGLSGRDLVTRMGISKQAVSQLVDTLVTSGYVARHPAPDDRRRTLLHLTPRGRSAARVIDDTVASLEAEMEAVIGREQLRALHEALLRLDEVDEVDDPR